MIFKRFFQIISWPMRVLLKPFGKRAGSALHESAGAATKSGAGAMAKAGAGEILSEEYREEPPRGIEAAMFKQLPRPRLTERAASELTLEQAQRYAEQASQFYDFEFPLFPRGDFFYEEIEESFTSQALGAREGAGEGSIDKRFVDVTTFFRRTLNDNSRRLLLYWAPVLGLLFFGGMSAALYGGVDILLPGGLWGIYLGTGALAAFAMFMVYSWPYKVVQQRNLLNLDNYITSKFARINNNFQVAKRRALNVERDKRMHEREALCSEAGAWTLSYHWFAMRLFLCETMLRNKFYQVRRNTSLYLAGGAILNLIILGSLGAGLAVFQVEGFALLPFAIAAFGYVLLASLATARATGMMFSVLQANEWSRFSGINLETTIRDHVGEDKLQIVTFRDRNRIE